MSNKIIHDKLMSNDVYFKISGPLKRFLYSSKISDSARSLFLYIYFEAYFNEDLGVTLSAAQISRQIFKSVNSVRRALNELVQVGLIRKENLGDNNYSSNRLYIIYPNELVDKSVDINKMSTKTIDKTVINDEHINNSKTSSTLISSISKIREFAESNAKMIEKSSNTQSNLNYNVVKIKKESFILDVTDLSEDSISKIKREIKSYGYGDTQADVYMQDIIFSLTDSQGYYSNKNYKISTSLTSILALIKQNKWRRPKILSEKLEQKVLNREKELADKKKQELEINPQITSAMSSICSMSRSYAYDI